MCMHIYIYIHTLINCIYTKGACRRCVDGDALPALDQP